MKKEKIFYIMANDNIKMIMTEIFDMSKLDEAIKHHTEFKESLQRLDTIRKCKTYNKYTEYKYAKNRNYGRLNANNGSFCKTSNLLREFIFDGEIEADIENCGAVMLNHHFNNLNIEHRYLEEYVKNRNVILKNLSIEMKKPIDKVKDIICIILSGCARYDNKNPFLNNLKQEMTKLKNILSNGETFNSIIERNEEMVNNAMLEYFKINLITPILYICDGFYLKNSINALNSLKNLNEYLFTNTKINVNVKINIIKNKLVFENIDTKYNKFYKDDQYIDSSIYSNNKHITIEAAMGMGKTKSMVDYLNSIDENEYERIIVVTSRRTYSRSIHKRYNKECKIIFEHYNSKNVYIPSSKNLIIQYESLYKLKDDEGIIGACGKSDIHKTLFILDEVESILRQMTSTKTNKININANIDMFLNLYTNAKKVVSMDAFIDRCLKFNNKLHLKSYDYYLYTKPAPQRFYVDLDDIYEGKEKFVKFQNHIINQLLNDKKIYIYVSSYRKSQVLYQNILSNKDLREKNLIIKLFNSSTNEALDEDYDAEEDWKFINCLITTSTITNGINYESQTNAFDSVNVYLSSQSHNIVRDVFQSITRPRLLNENKLYFVIDDSLVSKNYYVSKLKIKNDILGLLNLTKRNVKTKVDDAINYLESTTHYTKDELQIMFNLNLYDDNNNELVLDQLIDNTYESDMSYYHTRSEFTKYLNKCNYIKENSNDDSDIENYLTGFEFEISNEDVNFDTIKNISLEEYQLIFNKNVKSKEEIEIMLKFRLLQIYKTNKNINNMNEIYKLYKTKKHIFYNIALEKGIKNETYDLLKKLNDDINIFNAKYNLKADKIQEINNLLNLDSSIDTTRTFDKENLNLFLNVFKDNENEIYKIFDLRKPQRKTEEFEFKHMLTLLNKMYSSWSDCGFGVIKSSTKNINGKLTKVNLYGLENNNNEICIHNFYDCLEERTTKSKSNIYNRKIALQLMGANTAGDYINAGLTSIDNKTIIKDINKSMFKLNKFNVYEFKEIEDTKNYLRLSMPDRIKFLSDNFLTKINITPLNCDVVKFSNLKKKYLFIKNEDLQEFKTYSKEEQKEFMIDNLITDIHF